MNLKYKKTEVPKNPEISKKPKFSFSKKLLVAGIFVAALTPSPSFAEICPHGSRSVRISYSDNEPPSTICINSEAENQFYNSSGSALDNQPKNKLLEDVMIIGKIFFGSLVAYVVLLAIVNSAAGTMDAMRDRPRSKEEIEKYMRECKDREALQRETHKLKH